MALDEFITKFKDLKEKAEQVEEWSKTANLLDDLPNTIRHTEQFGNLVGSYREDMEHLISVLEALDPSYDQVNVMGILDELTSEIDVIMRRTSDRMKDLLEQELKNRNLEFPHKEKKEWN